MIELKLISAEIKKSLHLIIPFLISIIISFLLLGTAVFLLSNTFFKAETYQKQVLAIAAPKNDNLLMAIISSIEKMDSVEEICSFTYTDETNARKMLENGTATMAVIIPENFIKSLVYGENISAKILFTGNPSTSKNLIRELLDCGARLLGNSQSGIYSFIDNYNNSYNENIPKDVLFDVNLKYFDYVMDRTSIFEYEEISPTGEISIVEYFIASILLSFMLLTGIICSSLFTDNGAVIWHKLKIYGIGEVRRTIFKFFSVLTVIIIALLLFILFTFLTEYFIQMKLIEFNTSFFISILAVAFCVSSFVVFIYHITFNQIAGVLVLFVSSVSMIFLCGGFIPSVLLPQIFIKISYFLPIKPMIDVLSAMFANNISIKSFLHLFIWFLTFIIGSIISLKLREE